MPKFDIIFGAVNDTKTRISNLCKAINTAFNAKPSVPSWCRMCHFLSDYLLIATQHHDANVFDHEITRKCIGFLALPPKRIPPQKSLDENEWMTINYYTEKECKEMDAVFSELETHVAEWAVEMNGDENDGEDADSPIAAFLWKFHEAQPGHKISIFKAPLGQKQFRPYVFKSLAKQMRLKPITPREDVDYLPTLRNMSEFEEHTLKLQEHIANSVDMIVGDALCDGQARARVGTDSEIAQENEVLKRYRANGQHSLRGLVAQVLREKVWQLAGGHSNNEEGRKRCYNRVYAFIHPNRRRSAGSHLHNQPSF